MTTFHNLARLLKGGIVLLNAEKVVVQGIVALQCNADSNHKFYRALLK